MRRVEIIKHGILLMLFVGLILTCKKLPKEMVVKTGEVTGITQTSANVSGEIIDIGEGAIQYGHCYSITPASTINNNKTQLGRPAGPKVFTSSLKGLYPGTKYYVKAYITDGNEVVYGKEVTFSTLSCNLPTANTDAAANVTTTTATLNGTVNANGFSTTVTFEYGLTTSYGSEVTATQSPVTGSSNTVVSAGLNWLTGGTTYHYRVKAVNCGGTIYGSDQTFTTGCTAATATTDAATNIGTTTATLNGTVNANGFSTTVTFEYGLTTSYGSEVTATQSPVTGSSNTAVSAGLSGLTGGTTYHYRVKAVNCGGTVYGTDQTFTTNCTAPSATTGVATDISTTTAILNGTVKANYTPTTVTFEYGFTTSYGSTVTAAQSPLITGSSNTAVNAGLTGLTPNTTYHYRVKAVNCGGTVYGTDQTFTTNCTAPSATTGAATGVGTTTATLNGTVNANGFSTTVTFEYGLTTNYGSEVTATQSSVTGSSNTAVSAGLTGLTPGTTYHYRVKAVNCGGTIYGSDQTFTTGCIAPTATTNAATSVGTTTATLNGTVNANGSSTTVTFEYGLTTSYGSTITASQSPVTGSSNTAVSAGLTGLTPNTTYHYRVKAVNYEGTVYGEDYILKTYNRIINDVEGNTYFTVIIGTQEWMAENLKTTRYNDGTAIPLVTDNTEWSNLTTPGYCWNGNNIANKDTYGALYNWYTVNTGKLCPSGWHVPTDAEWTTMENYLIANGFNYDGTTTDNKIAKSLASTSGWAPSTNEGAVGNTDYPSKRNATGFTALPGGYRSTSTGAFYGIGYNGRWWSATEGDATTARSCEMYYDHTNVSRYYYYKKSGLSVRCVRD